jgi:signal transduction histidine kinase
VQGEIRALILELRREPVHHGLVGALASHASGLGAADGLTIDVRGPSPRLALSQEVETGLVAIGREALANVVRHAGATAAHVRVEAQEEHVVLEIRDNGRGFNTSHEHPGHFGLQSMRSRAAEIGARLTIASAPGSGTAVRVRVPVETDGT